MIIKDKDILRKNCEETSLEEGKEIIEKLKIELSINSNGIGLAAPQIGINKRVAIIRTEENVDLVNPIILEKRNGFLNCEESCLSFPGETFNIWRYKEIFVKDLLHPEGFVATNLEAIVIQHETDHLNGIIIPDIGLYKKIGRNDRCPCGSEKKFKQCCGR